MNVFRAFIRKQDGAAAAEFTLVLPLLLLLIFATIDFGRYAWSLGMADKAVQTGARHAVATNIVARGLVDYSYATNGNLAQGTIVPESAFPGVYCDSTGNSVSCHCPANRTCPYAMTADTAAFNSLVARMAQIYPGLRAQDVVVTYSWSGLGFAGDPTIVETNGTVTRAGIDVAPLTTVSIRNLTFDPFFGFGIGAVPMPRFSHTLSMEDGSGTTSN